MKACLIAKLSLLPRSFLPPPSPSMVGRVQSLTLSSRGGLATFKFGAEELSERGKMSWKFERKLCLAQLHFA